MSLQFELLDPENVMALDSFVVAESFLKSTRQTQLGWHYRIDIPWILSKLADLPAGSHVLDAGGGSGPLQFLLAELGFHVTNVDLHFARPARWAERRYGVTTRRLPSFERTSYSQHIESRRNAGIRTALRARLRALPGVGSAEEAWRVQRLRRFRKAADLLARPIGRISRVTANLSAMPELSSATFDAVVSLSALEHIALDVLPEAISELRRVVRPHGLWAVTTSASVTDDSWYHHPSRGQCFSRLDMARLFGARANSDATAAQLLEKYRRSRFLRTNLSRFYSYAGDNGMPWGDWNPSYVPVGIFGALTD